MTTLTNGRGPEEEDEGGDENDSNDTQDTYQDADWNYGSDSAREEIADWNDDYEESE